jgi:hypothetical protein
MNSTHEGRKLGLALGGRSDSTQIGELIDEGYKAGCSEQDSSSLCRAFESCPPWHSSR